MNHFISHAGTDFSRATPSSIKAGLKVILLAIIISSLISTSMTLFILNLMPSSLPQGQSSTTETTQFRPTGSRLTQGDIGLQIMIVKNLDPNGTSDGTYTYYYMLTHKGEQGKFSLIGWGFPLSSETDLNKTRIRFPDVCPDCQDPAWHGVLFPPGTHGSAWSIHWQNFYRDKDMKPGESRLFASTETIKRNVTGSGYWVAYNGRFEGKAFRMDFSSYIFEDKPVEAVPAIVTVDWTTGRTVEVNITLPQSIGLKIGEINKESIVLHSKVLVGAKPLEVLEAGNTLQLQFDKVEVDKAVHGTNPSEIMILGNLKDGSTFGGHYYIWWTRAHEHD
jgi:hypothetical protein